MTSIEWQKRTDSRPIEPAMAKARGEPPQHSPGCGYCMCGLSRQFEDHGQPRYAIPAGHFFHDLGDGRLVLCTREVRT